MKLFISGLVEVPKIIHQEKITKVLSMIEPWVNIDYGYQHKFVPDELQIERINCRDVEHGDHYLSPTNETIYNIHKWARNLEEEDNVLIHCYAGLSRSTAAAIIMIYNTLYSDLDLIEKTILQIRPMAAPNRYMCRLADNFFGHTDDRLFQLANRINQKNNWREFADDKGQFPEHTKRVFGDGKVIEK